MHKIRPEKSDQAIVPELQVTLEESFQKINKRKIEAFKGKTYTVNLR